MCSTIADVESLKDRMVSPYIQPLKPGLFLSCELGFSIFQNCEDYSEDSHLVKIKQTKKKKKTNSEMLKVLVLTGAVTEAQENVLSH